MAATETFYFYDLETSGVSPRSARIMQFAGQRVSMDLEPIGEPDNILVKLHEDILPEPEAILVTGITPQMTLADGITEAEFFAYFNENIATSGTIFVGFNSVRFDDEFMRFGLFRNFYDPYEWQWRDGASRWDLLDVVRTTRALRPEGIQWPFASDGKPTNRLELLSSLNGLDHESAHDALSDVWATIAVARLIQQKQPKLFRYLLSMRSKKAVIDFIASNPEFIYVSGKYNAEYEKLTAVCGLGPHQHNSGQIVFDLRYDPEPYLGKSPEELAELLRYKKDSSADRLPVKALQYNRCPAIAPLSVLRSEDAQRLQLDKALITQRSELVRSKPEFYENIVKAYEILNNERQQTALIGNENTAESQLYDSFLQDADKRQFTALHRASPAEIMNFRDTLTDPRLKALLPLYKARNFPKSLTDEERAAWEDYKNRKLSKKVDAYMHRLEELAGGPLATDKSKYLLEELALYAQSLVDVEE